MSTLTSRRCLVLNKTWTPVGTVNLQRAIIMLFNVLMTVAKSASSGSLQQARTAAAAA